jgi:aquaporin Z
MQNMSTRDAASKSHKRGRLDTDTDRITNFFSDAHNPRQWWQRLYAELLGTFLLTLVAAGADVISVATGRPADSLARYVAPALLVMAMVYTIGNVSGAHLNPVVTLAFSLRSDFPWRRVLGYWGAQMAGSLLAALFLLVIFGDKAHLGATIPNPRTGDGAALVIEIVLTALLVTVILGTAHNQRLVGHNAAFAVAGTIALAGLFAGPVSGASMNPARSFGPALLSGALGSYWIYLVGPVIGGLLAAGMAWILRGSHSPAAVVAATGDESADESAPIERTHRQERQE